MKTPFYPTDSLESTPLQHQQPPMATPRTPPPQQQQQQLLPLHGHEIMVIPQTPALTPPPTQPHPKEPKNDMSPPTIIFQQQNLPFSFSRQNSKTVGSPAAVVGATAEPSKKKRGRPRKSSVDGNTGVTGATSSENPSKKVRGRTSGSGKKQQQPKASGSVGLESTTRTIHVDIGEDIVSMVMTFLQQGPPAVCVLSATGNVRNVTLRRSAMGSDTVTYEGEFAIISLSGSLILSESNGNRGTTGGLGVLLSGPDGKVLSGVVTGMLIAASPVQVVVGRALVSQVPQATRPM